MIRLETRSIDPIYSNEEVLRKIKNNLVCDEISGCLAYVCEKSGDVKKTLILGKDTRKKLSIRKFLYVNNSKEMPTGKLMTKCGRDECVNPFHSIVKGKEVIRNIISGKLESEENYIFDFNLNSTRFSEDIIHSSGGCMKYSNPQKKFRVKNGIRLGLDKYIWFINTKEVLDSKCKIKHTCKERHCVNYKHFVIKRNQKKSVGVILGPKKI